MKKITVINGVVDTVDKSIGDNNAEKFTNPYIVQDDVEVFGGYADNGDGTFSAPIIVYPDATVEDVKTEAEKRILNSYPITKQINMLARATELQEIVISGNSLNETEQAEHDGLIAAKAWIASVRTASNDIELSPPKIDQLETDSRWP